MLSQNPHSIVLSFDHAAWRLAALAAEPEPRTCAFCGEIGAVADYGQPEGWECVNLDACGARMAEQRRILSATDNGQAAQALYKTCTADA